MNILLSAASFSPYRGSEPAIGWKVAMALARNHDVHVLTSRYLQADIAKAKEECLFPDNVHVHFVGSSLPKLNNSMLDKIQHWRDYFQYVRKVRNEAKRLMEQTRFDVIHHITYATWRTCVPLCGLPVPYVWGPVGGNERFPTAFLGQLSPSAIVFELVRNLSNFKSRHSRKLRAMIREADAVIASHPETYRLLQTMRGSRDGLWELSVTAFSNEEISRFSLENKKWHAGERPLRAFCGGMLEGRKGVALALHAIAKAKAMGIHMKYTIAAHGPEVNHLKSLSTKLGLDDQTSFVAPLRGDGYTQALIEADVYLLPSLRDNAPITLMEAMLCGCVPIVADCGGPASIVGNDCGFRVSVESGNAAISGIYDAIAALHNESGLAQQMGVDSRNRILNNYSMEHYMDVLSKIYQEVPRPSR